MSNPRYILAVDGGGSTCRVRLSAPDGSTISEARSGPANINSDFDGARRAVSDAIAKAKARAQESCGMCPTVHPAACYFGLAGANASQRGPELTQTLGYHDACVTSDLETTVQGALGDADGVVALFGTGSLFAGREAGTLRHIGGWGFVLGDQGGGAWIGREALHQTIRAHDGQQSMTALAQDFLDRYNGPAGIVGFATSATPQDFGALAPDVLGYAHQGDPIARAICNGIIDELRAALTALRAPKDAALCLTGGLAGEISRLLPQDLAHRCVPSRGTPLDGATQLALKALREKNQAHD